MNARQRAMFELSGRFEPAEVVDILVILDDARLRLVDDTDSATFVDGTKARDLNVGRLGLCGKEAMERAVEREQQ